MGNIRFANNPFGFQDGCTGTNLFDFRCGTSELTGGQKKFAMNTQRFHISSELLDAQQIQMLLEATPEDARSLLEEITELFREESLANLESIKQALESQERNQLVRSFHALAGSSANIGAHQLWEVAKTAETRATEADLDEFNSELPSMQSLREQTLAAFEDILEQLRS